MLNSGRLYILGLVFRVSNLFLNFLKKENAFYKREK